MEENRDSSNNDNNITDNVGNTSNTDDIFTGGNTNANDNNVSGNQPDNTEKPVKKKPQKRFKPSTLFFLLFITLGILFTVFILIFPKAFAPVTVYRRTQQTLNYTLKENLHNIYNDSEAGIETKYEKIQNIKNENIEKGRTINKELIETENKIIKNGINDINQKTDSISHDPFNYLPQIEDLIKIYEQIPSLDISKALDNPKTVTIDNSDTDERSFIKKTVLIHNDEIDDLKYHMQRVEKYPNNENFKIGLDTKKEEIKEIIEKVLNYIKTRIKIAKNTSDDEWAYNIISDTYEVYVTKNYYKDGYKYNTGEAFDLIFSTYSNFDRDIYNEYTGLKREIMSLANEISGLKVETNTKIEEVNKIYYSGNPIDTRYDELNNLLIQANETEKSFRLRKHIIERQSGLVEEYYDKFLANINNIIINYKDSSTFYNILNTETVKQIMEEIERYIEKDFVFRFPDSSKIVDIREAYDYLKLISGDNMKYAVKLNNIKLSGISDDGKGNKIIYKLSEPFDNLRIYIGLYDNFKTYSGERLDSEIKSEKATPIDNGTNHLYNFNEEFVFSWKLGKQIVIRFYSDKNYILSISSNERANLPTDYSLEDEKGNHFLIFEGKNINFDYNGKTYKLELSFDTRDLPKFPPLLVDIFK